MQLFCDVGNGVLQEHSIHVHDEGCSPMLKNGSMSPHIHGPNCGHERVWHGDHYDYLVRTYYRHERPCESAEYCPTVMSSSRKPILL